MEHNTIIELIEYKTLSLSNELISTELSEVLISKFRNQIQVEPPWALTNYQWRLTSLGWVGYIKISDKFGISLIPKVPLENLFRMLSYAYKLKSIIFFDDEFQAETIQDFYDFLAEKLSRQILNRYRKGLYREYLSINDELPFVSGRINFNQLLQHPWRIKLASQYQKHTADVEFNQILSYTLDIIARSGLCSKRVIPIVRKAYRTISRYSRLIPFSPKESISLLYNRLNIDYRPMHVLCRFFIEHVGPRVTVGGHTMLPFIVDMSKLFELFVAEWLKDNLPDGYKLISQQRFFLGENDEIFFKADVIIKNKRTDSIHSVLDTKYKSNESPSPEDIAQIISYAQSNDCKDAILVYPIKLQYPFNGYSGDIHIRCLSFAIDGDIEQAGKDLLRYLFSEPSSTN